MLCTSTKYGDVDHNTVLWGRTDLFLGNPHVVLDASEDGGLNEAATVADATAAGLQLGALFLSRLNQLQDLLSLLAVDLSRQTPTR